MHRSHQIADRVLSRWLMKASAHHTTSTAHCLLMAAYFDCLLRNCLLKQLYYAGIAPIQSADVRKELVPVLIENVGGWKGIDADFLQTLIDVHKLHRVIVLRKKGVDAVRRVVGDHEKNYFIAICAVVRTFDGRHFLQAVAAPGGPVIHEERFAAKIIGVEC